MASTFACLADTSAPESIRAALGNIGEARPVWDNENLKKAYEGGRCPAKTCGGGAWRSPMSRVHGIDHGAPDGACVGRTLTNGNTQEEDAMSPESVEALATLKQIARGHPGASSGERAAWEILQNFQDRTRIDFADCFTRLDGTRKFAVIQLLFDLASGKTGLVELD